MELGDWTLYSVLALIVTAICAYYGYKTFLKKSSNVSNTKFMIKDNKIKGDIIAGDKIMGNKITSKDAE